MALTSRREFLQRSAASGLAAALAGPVARAAQGSTPPNILFVFSDDHAGQAIGAYGSRINKTPHIDRIGREGAVFENCFCANSICGPSRATVLTGTFSHINGFRRNGAAFDGDQVTYPKLLQKAGYQTAMIGKWHLNSQPTGFDYWKVLPGQGAYYNPDFIGPEGRERIEGYVTDIITDVSLDWLVNRRDPDRPFLLHCWHKAPHRAWMPGPKYLSNYERETIPEPDTLFDDYATRSSSALKQAMTIANHMNPATDLKLTPPLVTAESLPGQYRRMTDAQKRAWDAAYVPRNQQFREQAPSGDDLTRWRYQRYIKDYLRCIDSVDESVGRLLAALDEHDLARNTLVIYSSDQGFYLGEHGWYDKRWMYEESLRMPLLMRWPERIRPGQRPDQLVQNIDVAPTLLAAAALPDHERIQGESVVPLITGGDRSWRQSIYYHYYEFPGAHSVQKHCGVRTKTRKLIHFYPVDEWEFYDLTRDPRELNNLYDHPAHADEIARLKLELERLQALYGDNTVRSPTEVAAEARQAGFDYWEKVLEIRETDDTVLIRGEPSQDGACAMFALERAPIQMLTLRSRMRRRVHSGIANGFVAVAPPNKPGKILRGGVYIRANSILIQSGLDTLASAPLPGDPDRLFDVAMTVNPLEKKVILTVDGMTVEADLPEGFETIGYVGYSLNRTATEFTKLNLESD